MKRYWRRGGSVPLLGKTVAEQFAKITERFAAHSANDEVVEVTLRR